MTRAPFLLLLATVLAATGPAPVTGTAQVVDGDTLRIGDTKVRLFGIDAPEISQQCTRQGASWACGEASARQLRSLVEGQQVACLVRGLDNYGRSVAVCSARAMELNRTMVAAGWAVAFRNYSSDYVADEVRAKAGRAGIWSSSFVLPQDYRLTVASTAQVAPVVGVQSRSSRVAQAPPVMGRCAIKGNRNRKGQWIYHVPGMPYYEATRAEEIFCSEAQAQAAGYRRALVR
ncbi:thermonuclease family protein [Altererythrobacter aerius]|uniref:Thermonuclease family protein n=1 Tax=Tsuneonella aeria TaxID=1837929 RepID=A0A6I4TGU3_9SPHN|nr:thermonuclease family protein [Tsuneonella aeria]MXO75758.1 thermonuclease family protein [Tsuneonella aeria]